MLRLTGPFDPSKIAGAWCDALTAAGLGRVRVSGTSVRHDTLDGRRAKFSPEILPPGKPLAEHLSAELNRPFDDPEAPPFRPFLAPTDGGYYFGVVYQHWVADSVSIRLLLREWFVRLYDPPRARAAPLRQPTGGYRDLFGPSRPGWRPGEVLLLLLRRHGRYRRARKVKTFGPRDYPVRVLLRDAPAGLIDRLRDVARAQGLKLNDVFLAAAAEACHRFIPAQLRPGRPDFAIGSIVDLRPTRGPPGATWPTRSGCSWDSPRSSAARPRARLPPPAPLRHDAGPTAPPARGSRVEPGLDGRRRDGRPARP